jgi:hypothetical protein
MAKFNLKEHIAKNQATFFGSLTEGQFSWMTQDTGQQIGSQDGNTIPVYMFDDKGKYYYENEYEGYGVFGGKDYYELLDQMNGGSGDRSRGIDLAFNKEETPTPILFPALITRPSEFDYTTHDFTKEAKHDPNQSWYAAEEDDFYDQNDEEEYGYDDEDEELEEGYQGQFYAPEYLEQKYGKEMADKITAEIEEMDENSYDRFTEFTTAKEVEDYISDIKDMLNLNEVKTTTKMKMSELKAKIKEMILAEAELDIQNSSENNSLYDPLAESDFLAELEGMLDDEEEFSVTLLVPTVYFNPETGELAETPAAFGADSELEDMGITNYSDGDELSEWVFDNDIEKAKYFEKEYPGLFKVEGAMNEAKDKETNTEEVTDDVTDGEETVDVTDDFSMEEPQGPGKIDVTQNANADLTGTKKDVQDNLEAALEAARALGDEKLATQVGNTITFFNKQHVVKDTTVAENLNESMFPMLKKILK